VSSVETPPPEAATAPAERRCPRCGATLTPEQEWCLECGSAVGTTFVEAPSWRGPVLLVATLLTIAVAALVLALVELAGDAEQVAQQPAPTTQATPPPPATATPAATPTIPPASDPGTSAIGDWPAGQEGWTVVLEAAATEAAAQARAEELAQQGIPVGMLESDDFGSLEPGRYVVFSGQYDSKRAADQALTDLSDRVEGAYVRRVAAE
jgi:septal ring-binding cell division protein DamX